MPPSKKGTLKVEWVPIKSVKPAKGNARVHPPEQVQQIARSIQENGWTKPIVVDERREILAGHGARLAALQLGETEVPIIARHGLSQAQKRAYRIADNKVAENSEWDSKLLATELDALKAMGFDMALTGFDTTEIDLILRPPPSKHTEPPVPSMGPPVSILDDVWQMDGHRLICGDSTKGATYKTLMNGRQAAMVFTDPPYGVSYQGRGLGSSRIDIIKGDELRRGKLLKMLQSSFAAALANSRTTAPWYIWHGPATRKDFEQAMQSVGLVEPANGYIVWVKPPTMGWGDYRSAFEPCFYAHRQGESPPFYGNREQMTTWEASAKTDDGEALELGGGVLLSFDKSEIQVGPAQKGKRMRHVNLEPGQTILLSTVDETSNVWRIGRGKEGEKTVHPTQKPVELARRAIRNSSQEGDIVLDFFHGGGSTLIGCEQLRRTCYAVELDPQYVDAAVRRWQTMTGKTAIHAEEKQTFEAITKARAGETRAR